MNKYAPSLTDAAFDALPLSERIVLVAAYYCDRVRVREHPEGSNRGPEIDAWAHEFGTPLGSPWCGLFVSHVLKAAGYTGPMPQNPASTHSWAEWATSHGKTAPSARRGDVFVLLTGKTTGHMGFFTQADGSTIEGNTNDDGSREGYEVARRKRNPVEYKGKRVIVRLTPPGGK